MPRSGHQYCGWIKSAWLRHTNAAALPAFDSPSENAKRCPCKSRGVLACLDSDDSLDRQTVERSVHDRNGILQVGRIGFSCAPNDKAETERQIANWATIAA